MALGDELRFGGGAAPIVIVRRPQTGPTYTVLRTSPAEERIVEHVDLAIAIAVSDPHGGSVILDDATGAPADLHALGYEL